MKTSTTHIIIGALAVLVLLQAFWIYQLTEDVKERESQLSDMSNRQSTLIQEVNQIIEDINTYRSEVDRSMLWFQSNSVLRGTSTVNARRHLAKNCVQIKDSKCYIKSSCFYWVNDELLGLEYKKDIEVSDSQEKLQSISQFLEHGGGDCEDYALFYKAEFNYLLEQCKNTNEIILESWVHDAYSKEWYWLNNDKTWYITGVAEHELEGYSHPIVVCGTMYNEEIDKIQGHCVVAFTEKEISSESDLIQLNSAPMIEPQNGIYLGNINESTSGTYLLTKDNYKNKPIKSIYLVIADNDLYMFNEKTEEWIGYSSFSEKLSKYGEELKLQNN